MERWLRALERRFPPRLVMVSLGRRSPAAGHPASSVLDFVVAMR